jgi:hypothetical protein
MPPETRLLTHLAWWNVALHLLGLVLALVGMRPGSPAFDLETRRAYLAAFPLAWSLGWGTWMLCALLQIAFYAVLARHFPEHPDVARLAVMLACAGMAIDLSCDTIFLAVLPHFAAGGPENVPVFLALEKLTDSVSLVVANSLYVFACFLLTMCLRDRVRRAPLVIAAGGGVLVFGLLLSAAGFTGSWLAELATGPTIVCYCAWVLLATRSVNSGGGVK